MITADARALLDTCLKTGGQQRRLVRLCIAAAALTLASGCKKDDAAPPVVVEVQAATVEEKPISQHIEIEAVLGPLATAALSPKITAPVRKFYVQRGARVEEGQLLATLENRDLQSAAADARGSYDAAQASYQTTTKAQVPEDFQKAQLDLAQAQANLALQQRIVDSRKQLFSQGAIPGRDLDTAQAALVQSQSAYDSAKKHLDSMQAVSRQAALQGAAGQLESAKGKYLGAEAQLSYSEIRSPIHGVVTDRPLFAGETAAAGSPLITVMDTSALIAKTHLPQEQAQLLRTGSDASVAIRGLDEPLPAKVSLISPALDPGSTTVEVWVRVANQDGKLRAGTPVHVSLVGRTAPKALLVPGEAVLTGQDGKKTALVIGDDSVAHMKEIATGIEYGGEVQVTGGLSAGQHVVSAGAYGLDDNTKVKVVSAEDIEKEKEKPKAASAGAGA